MPNHIMKHASFCNAIIILSQRSIWMNENAVKNLLRKHFYIWNNDPRGPIRDDRRAKWLHYTQKLQKLHFSYPQQWLSFNWDLRTCSIWPEYLDESGQACPEWRWRGQREKYFCNCNNNNRMENNLSSLDSYSHFDWFNPAFCLVRLFFQWKPCLRGQSSTSVSLS